MATSLGIFSTSLLPEIIFLSPVVKARFATAEECGAIGVVSTGSVRASSRLIPAKVETPTSELDPFVVHLEGLSKGCVKLGLS